MNVIIFGPPGAGKGTQAALLRERLGMEHFSTGEEFRRHITDGTALGQQIRAIVESGDLVPDAIVLDVVRDALQSERFRNGCIFDGFPRTLEQAYALDKLLADLGQAVDAVLTIDVPDDELVRRMLARGRSDDTESVIRERLRIYRERTEPVLEYYQRQGKLFRILGNAPIEQVHQEIRSVLSSLATKQ
ncbi:Adenylate kinase [bacterium HR20]|uniref:Adenylate kinase n=1 Tax=uncultured Bacteroidota bacterium TaxID=152509 RepID=H5SBN7_9BACT|nr:adenylate kinase [uncultured Bacteroidetes bacterium]GBD04566.1 Adenylate kinase [bacterium HR20]